MLFVIVIAVRNSIYLKTHCPLDYREGKSRVGISSCVHVLCVIATSYLAQAYHKDNV